MKVAIIGSRGIENIDISSYIPEEVTEIISGGAKGVDSLAEACADKQRISKHIIRPDYKKYPSRSAPVIRNKLIVEQADFILVFWDGKSKGTLSAIKLAKKMEKEVVVVECLEGEFKEKNKHNEPLKIYENRTRATMREPKSTPSREMFLKHGVERLV